MACLLLSQFCCYNLKARRKWIPCVPISLITSLAEELEWLPKAWVMAVNEISPSGSSPSRNHQCARFRHRLSASNMAMFFPLLMPFLESRSSICHLLLLEYLYVSIPRGDCPLFSSLSFLPWGPCWLVPYQSGLVPDHRSASTEM